MAARVVDYGVDAPGVMRGLLGGGLAGLLVGGVVVVAGKGVVATAVGGLIVAGALVPFGLGLAMAAYASAGKRRLRDWMLGRHPWRGDETVLDIGAGRGLMAVGAAKRVPRGRVIALDVWRSEDLSGNGPEALTANATAEGVGDRIAVSTGDARALDLPEGSIDVVLSVLCFHNIEPAAERDRALHEIARVLKPGGRALIADYMGAGGYARTLRRAGLDAQGPVNAMRPALSLMALVEADKPAGGEPTRRPVPT